MKCQHCDNDYTQVWQHESFCKLNPNRKTKKKPPGKCKFCRVEYAQVGVHEVYCKLNPNRRSRTENSFNQFSAAVRDGKPVPIVTKITRDKLRKNSISNNYWSNGSARENAKKKQAHSKRMSKIAPENPESYALRSDLGRVKRVVHNGIHLHGTWELEVAKLLDRENLRWVRPSSGVPYMWKGTTHNYFPDFYVKGFKIYIEVKGFETAQDQAKWKHFPNLLVIKRGTIAAIRRGEFSLRKELRAFRKELSGQ